MQTFFSFQSHPEVSFAGSLRRWKETVGTIRLVVNTERPAKVIEHLLGFPSIVEVIEKMGACEVRLLEGGVSVVAAALRSLPSLC